MQQRQGVPTAVSRPRQWLRFIAIGAAAEITRAPTVTTPEALAPMRARVGTQAVRIAQPLVAKMRRTTCAGLHRRPCPRPRVHAGSRRR